MKLSLKFAPAIVLVALCAFPAAAQTVRQTGNKNNQTARPVQGNTQTVPAVSGNRSQRTQTSLDSLGTHIKDAVTRAQAECICNSEELSPQELIEAEEELQRIRDKKDSNATFSKYPYLLDPVYRRQQNGTCSYPTAHAVSPATQEDRELSPREQIDAETELSRIRNTWDMHATFEKYPYLLSPAYRRAASEDTKRSIRRQYTNPSWARSVGL